jgi:hypothetical protein
LGIKNKLVFSFHSHKGGEKVNLIRFGELLEKATERDLLEWDQTEDEVEENGKVYRGYETKFGDWIVRTVVRQVRKTTGRLLVHDRVVVVRAIEIEGKQGTVVFSSDPKVFRGEKADPTELFVITATIQRLVENKDPLSTLCQQLVKLLHETSK